MTIRVRLKRPRWQRRKYSPLARQRDIFFCTVQLMLSLGWDKLWGNDTPKQRNRRAQWLVNQLLELGPTFIKIGQALSTRPDLIPLEYVSALGQLQDKVPEFSSQDAIAVVETELANSVHTLYREFDRAPLASASLGQVHKAKLHTGEEVVVKVQRPGIEQLFNLDFEVLHRTVRWLNRFMPWARKYKLEEIYQEFFSLLFQEIDYVHEGKNADRFRNNFSDRAQIIVPTVYWRYTTKKILTLEYVPGIKINDRQTIEACGINPDKIIQLGICAYLKQLLEDGFFQSDPHPGNMAVRQDGCLIFYDFGTMTEVKAIAKDQMVKTFFAVLRKDAEEVVNTLTYMGLIEPQSDMTSVKRLVAFLLEQFRERPVDIKELDRIRDELYVMFEEQPFRLPAQMTFIIKALTTLDGIARALDPQYNLLAASQPFVKSLTFAKHQGNLFGTLAQQAKQYLTYRLNQPSKVELYLSRLEARIEQGEFKVRIRSLESERLLKRIHLAIKCLIYLCGSGLSLVAGILLLNIHQGCAIALFVCAGVSCLIFLRCAISLYLRERMDRLASR
ncbi:ABC1 kinase family protein [Lusitaniella coriacea]|uniref:ABC1 kinase family protein n=1 Tax=Lusitaniella coriacea TaxID=1983105 RepID=UPI003CE7C5A3